MNQKREEIAIAFAAAESAEMNIKEAGNFIQDAIELEIPTFVSSGLVCFAHIPMVCIYTDSVHCVCEQESSWSFIEIVGEQLTTLNKPVALFLTTPAIWHYCKSEDALHQYLLPDEDDD